MNFSKFHKTIEIFVIWLIRNGILKKMRLLISPRFPVLMYLLQSTLILSLQTIKSKNLTKIKHTFFMETSNTLRRSFQE